MTKDPVCGMQVDENKAPATSSYQGKQYAFCGQECKDKFDEQPERYAHSKPEQSKKQSKPEHAHR
jgi:YHS domain-containing protein